MKPFNLQEALAGKRVVNGYGDEAKNVTHFPSANQGEECIAASVDGQLQMFTISGQYLAAHPCQSDLHMGSEKREAWLNLYKMPNGERCAGNLYDTKQKAKDATCEDTALRSVSHIAVRVEWEE